MVEDIYYVMRVGCPWRELPEHFGPWQSVYTRWCRWSASGLWPQILQTLSIQAKGPVRCVDCSYVKVHQHGGNPHGGQAPQHMGKTKGGLNSKLAALVDHHGRAICLQLACGHTHDLQATESFFTQLHKLWLLGDKAFDSDKLRTLLAKNQCIICIPPKSNRTLRYYYSKALYKQRHVVENFFCRIKKYRRIATRYDKLSSSFLNFVTFASIIDWISFPL